jgi:hypothetical protein
MTTTPSQLVVPASLVMESWLKKHERIVLVSLVLLFGSLGLHHFLFNQASASALRATVAEQALVAAKATNVQQASQTAAVEAQYQSITDTLAKQNAALAASVASRQVVLTQRQTENATLPPTALAKEFQVLTGVQDADISADTTGLKLTPTGALTTVNLLETIPVLQKDLADTDADLGTTRTALGTANGVIAAQGTQIIGLNVTLVTQAKKAKDELDACKKAGRLQSFRWFVRGAVTGFIAGVFAGHAL